MTPDAGTETARKRRRDFAVNREAILAAADAAFAEVGIRASIESIADSAGVAPATVYRHFPNRADLTDAVAALRIEAYTNAIAQAQEVADDAKAFRRTIHAFVELQARDRSFREIIASSTRSPAVDPRFASFAEALLGALTRADQAGVLREGVTQQDAMLLLLATEGIARPVGDESEDSLKRFLDLALDGICADRAAIRGEPLELDQLFRAVSE